MLIEIRKSKLVDFGANFQKIGKIFIQGLRVSNSFWNHNLAFLKHQYIQIFYEYWLKSNFL